MAAPTTGQTDKFFGRTQTRATLPRKVPANDACKLRSGSFSTVSGLFRAGNTCPGAGLASAPLYAGPVTGPAADSATFSLETASWGRRVLALAVDWFACVLAVMVVLGPAGWVEDPNSGFYTLLVFVVESTLLTATVGGSFGKIATRLRVVRVDGDTRPVPLLKALARAVLVALVVPPLVFRPDRRGLHDLVAGSATVTLQAAKADAAR